MGEGGSGRGQRASTEEGALTRVCGGDGRPVGRGQCKERCSIDGVCGNDATLTGFVGTIGDLCGRGRCSVIGGRTD